MYLLGIALSALILSGVIAAWRDPRRLRPGVYLTAAVNVAVLIVVLAAVAVSGSRMTGAWVLLIIGMCGLFAVVALGVFLVINGAVLLRREGIRPPTMVSTVLGVILFCYAWSIIVAIALGWFDPERSNTALLLLAAVGLPAGYLGFVLVAAVSWSWIYAGWARRRAGREPVRAVIVLGAGLIDGRDVGPLLAARLERGREIFEFSRAAGRSPLLVCSGGRGDDEETSEAAAMAHYLEASGVDGGLILLEDRSTDTAENLTMSAMLLAENRIGAPVAVVTSNYHALRAATQMRAAGIDGFCVGAATAPYFVPNASIREFAALVRDHWRLNLTAVIALSVPWVLGLWAVLER